ncbi:MAG TPA: hypothetical protein VG326_13410 [Tepidisphaeraceae bacterium]|nr:hypothetical protein [Tepidisphaeraceae bacterium]
MFEMNRGNGRKRSLQTSHPFNVTAKVPTAHKIGVSAASEKPAMESKTIAYNVGMNWRMSYIQNVPGGVGK